MSVVLPEPLKKSGQLREFAAFSLRLLARASLAVYFGGFTFYAAVVVPDLHEHLGGMETGEISRRVAVILYAIGAAAFGLGWFRIAVEKDLRPGWRGKTRIGFLVLNSMLLIALMLMHRSLGRQIDSSSAMDAFQSFHELYLTVWTGQWLGVLGLMAVDVTATKSSTNLGNL